MRPQPDDYPEHIEATLRALVEGGPEAGAKALEPIAYPPRAFPPRRGLTREQMVRIFKRDAFTCRYCRGKTIMTPIMEILGTIYPESFPFQSAGWKAGVTHPAVISRSPAVDHVAPVVLGGTNDDANLVTACTPCNTIKSDFTLEMLGWELQPIATSDWDGLTRYYPRLWRIAGEPKAEYHLKWMRALGLE